MVMMRKSRNKRKTVYMAALLNTYVYRMSNNKAMCNLYSSWTIYINVLIILTTQIYIGREKYPVNWKCKRNTFACVCAMVWSSSKYLKTVGLLRWERQMFLGRMDSKLDKPRAYTHYSFFPNKLFNICSESGMCDVPAGYFHLT